MLPRAAVRTPGAAARAREVPAEAPRRARARSESEAEDRLGARRLAEVRAATPRTDPWLELALLVAELLRPRPAGVTPTGPAAAEPAPSSPAVETTAEAEAMPSLTLERQPEAEEAPSVPAAPAVLPAPAAAVEMPAFPQPAAVSALPVPRELAAALPAAPAARIAAAVLPASGGAEGEVSHLRIVSRWRSGVATAAGGMPRPAVGVEPEARAALLHARGEAHGRQQQVRQGLGEEALATVPAPPEVEAPPSPPPGDPVPEHTQRVLALSERRLPDIIAPALVRSELRALPDVASDAAADASSSKVGGNLPSLGERPVAADLFQILTTPGARSLAAIPAADAASEAERGEAREMRRALDQLTRTGEPGQRQATGAPVIAPDTGPQPVPPLPEALQVPVGEVVARLLADVEPAASAALDTLRQQAYPGGVLKLQFPAIGAALRDELRGTLDTELREIAAAANVSAEQLEGLVAQRRRELAEQGRAARADATQLGQEAGDDVAAQGQETMDAIEGAAGQAEEQTLQRQEAATGGSDPTVINRRRDRTVAWIREHVTTQITHYQQAGERRTTELQRVRSSQGNAYRALVQREQYQVLTPQPPARPAREPSDSEREGRLADLANAIRVWGDGVVAALEESIRLMLADTTTRTRTHRGEIEAAGNAGIEAARVWAEDRVLQGQSWWTRFVARIRRWLGQAGQLQEQWRVRRTRENRDAVANDLQVVEAARQRLAQGVTQEELLADQTLSQAERAILEQFFAEAPGTHPLDFAARRLRDNVALGLLERAREVFENELIATPVGEGDYETAEKLNQIARSQGGGFDAARIAQEVHAAMDQIGTDEQRIFDNLRGLTRLRGAVARKYYYARYGDDLDAELESEMSGDELDQAVAQLEGRQARADAIALHDAVAGAGTDEAAIMRTLRNKTPAEMEAIRAEYLSLYGETLQQALENDLEEGNEIDQANALMAGDTATADAIAFDEAMRGGFTGWGTDEAEIERVQNQVRSEVLARAQAEHWSSAQMEAEVRRRLAEIEARFEARYRNVEQYNQPGLQGGTVLARAFSSELSEAQLDLANALQRNDLIAADAARLEIERGGFYASDETITRVLRSQYERALQARRLDEGPARQRVIAREIEAARAAGRSEEDVSRIRMAAERRMERELEDGAQRDSSVSMETLRAAYEGRYNRLSLAYDIEMMTSGSDRLVARNLLRQGGRLTPYQEVEFATVGDGTDEDTLRRVLSRATRAEIAEIRRQWEERHPGRNFDAMLRGELSGRDESDIMDMVHHGAPESALEQIDQERRRVRRELGELTGVLGGSAAGREEAWMRHELGRLRELEGPLQRTDWPDTEEGRRARERLTADVDFRLERVQQAVEDHRRRLDSYTDMVTQVVGMAVGITVAVLLGAVSGGTLGVATIAIMASLMATASTMLTKQLILGGAYGDEAVLTDLAVGVVDALASAATAGMGTRLLRPMRGLVARTRVPDVAGWIGRSGVAQRATRAPGAVGRMAGKLVPSRSGVERAVASFMAEGVEDAVGAVPSSFATMALSDQTWRGDPLMNFLEGGGMAILQGVAMGRTLSFGMGAGGHLFNLGRGHLRSHSEVGRLLEANRLIQEGLGAHLQDNPGASLLDFLHHPDGRRLRADIERRGLLPTLDSVRRSGGAAPGHTDTGAPLRAAPDAAQARADELAAALPGRLREGTFVSPDPTLPGRTVRVEPLRIGRQIVGVEVRAGPDATPLDIALHAATVHAMQRYRGVLGNVRRALEDAAALMTGSGLTVGSRGWEARLEMGKLSAIVASRMDELSTASLTPELEGRLVADALALQAQLEGFRTVLGDPVLRAEPGRGHVAAEDLSTAWHTLPRHDEHGRLTAVGLEHLRTQMEQLQSLPEPRTRAEVEARRELLESMEALSGVDADTLQRLASLDVETREAAEDFLLARRSAGPKGADRPAIRDQVEDLAEMTGLDVGTIARLADHPQTLPHLELLLRGSFSEAEIEPPVGTAGTAAVVPRPSRAQTRARIAESVMRGGGEPSLEAAMLDPAWTARITLAAYLTTRGGLTSFDEFLASPQVSQLLSRARPLNEAQVARLRDLHQQAQADAVAIEMLGRQLGLPEAMVESFFGLWASHPDRNAAQIMAAMSQLANSGALRFREFPSSMLDAQTLELLGGFGQRISTTMLPQHLSARRTPEGGLEITIEAPVLPGWLSRNPRGGQAAAANFNATVREALRRVGFFAASGLNPASWQVMHLLGPSSGIEAAAGLLLGPTSINVGLQTRRYRDAGGIMNFEGVEVFIGEIAARAIGEGGDVTVRSTVESWPRSDLPPALRTPQVEFFRSVEYEIRVTARDGSELVYRVVIEADRPPASGATMTLLDIPAPL